jgi:Uma2 family endonuclease
MASVTGKLSFAEFQLKYAQSERSHEYWDGEAIPKAMPTAIHAVLQALLCRLLWQAGYKSGSEVELRIDPRYHPKPDIYATTSKVEVPYPTRAVEVVIEILSPDDSMSHLLEKCRLYEQWGFSYVCVVDPDSRLIYRYTTRGLETTDTLVSIPAGQIWTALDQDLA